MRSRFALLADSDRAHSNLIATALENGGFQVVQLQSAEDVFPAALHRGPDVVLMDIELPDRAAWRALRQLQDGDETCDVPVIALSTPHRFGESRELLDAGFCGCLIKPVSPGAVVAAVRHCLTRTDAGDRWVDLSGF